MITKGDLVSPTEREIFLYNVKKANRKARVFFVNGLNGQGIYKLDQILQTTGEIQAITDKYLRFTMPAAVCTYCAGQTKVGGNDAVTRIKAGMLEE